MVYSINKINVLCFVMTPLIIHHHIFKNSGTSFDQILKLNFGNTAFFEDSRFPFFRYTSYQVEKIISTLHAFKSISSHQFPHPYINEYDLVKDRAILSVTFLRDPITRVKSIYGFKKKYADDSKTSENAQKYNFKDWLKYSVEDKFERVHVSNSQCSFFSIDQNGKAIKKSKDNAFIYDLKLAKKNLSKFFFCGITENFENSIHQLNKNLEDVGVSKLKHRNVRENVTTTNFNDSLETRIEKIFDEIGEELAKELLKINQQDIELRDFASKKFLEK